MVTDKVELLRACHPQDTVDAAGAVEEAADLGENVQKSLCLDDVDDASSLEESTAEMQGGDHADEQDGTFSNAEEAADEIVDSTEDLMTEMHQASHLQGYKDAFLEGGAQANEVEDKTLEKEEAVDKIVDSSCEESIRCTQELKKLTTP